MHLMAAMRYFDCLESEMSREQFEDHVWKQWKVKLAFAPRLRTSSSGAALLDEAFQVGQYFILLHIITHYLHVSIMNPGMIHTRSGRRRLCPIQQMGWIQFCQSTLRIARK
jgi:hypothetical protein